MFLSPSDVAEELGVSRSLVAQWIRQGRIQVQRDRRGWAWIEPQEVERIRHERRQKRRRAIRPKFGPEEALREEDGDA